MACPESMQFFQFDSKGNMFVYAPGAGCTGEAKLVALEMNLYSQIALNGNRGKVPY